MIFRHVFQTTRVQALGHSTRNKRGGWPAHRLRTWRKPGAAGQPPRMSSGGSTVPPARPGLVHLIRGWSWSLSGSCRYPVRRSELDTGLRRYDGQRM